LRPWREGFASSFLAATISRFLDFPLYVVRPLREATTKL
jgi:hypothetical protein